MLLQLQADADAHLQELPVIQIFPDILHNPCACLEDAAHMVVVDNAIEVPLPISGFLTYKSFNFNIKENEKRDYV